MKNIILRLIVLVFLIFSGLSVRQVEAATQIDIPGPMGSGRFGSQVVTLPNGNIVVTDPEYVAPTGGANVGAVYLYNGATGALIRRLTEIITAPLNYLRLTPLPNGNLVVADQNSIVPGETNVGAVYLYNGLTGALISRLTGTYASTFGNYIVPMPNGNFIVGSSSWNNGAGAVTFCNGTTGCNGTVSATNSLVGSGLDYVGYGDSGINVLANGNYVVSSTNWNNGVGAVTFCNGTTGCRGVVSAANSLVGSQTNDGVGGFITPLTDGNYVVSSWRYWNNGAGAVTFCNGTTGCTGVVSAANSLIGSQPNDFVGEIITPLANGNYVVGSRYWNNGSTVDAGAVTWCNGTTGCTGAVSIANSLVGSTANNLVLLVWALENGNYVVGSPSWDNGATADVGALTFCDGTTGCTGTASAANSLVGSTANDQVGRGFWVLANGNYVVGSYYWDNGATADVGAVTWCNGTTGCTGVVSAANSLVGSTANDQVGGIIPLTNGNYVVTASYWDNGATTDVGAATFCNGTSGCTGAVSSANSLVGSTAGDRIGGFYNGVTALPNGNYVVSSRDWDNGAIINAGAVTFCNGSSGCTGAVSSTNSLVGSSAGDSISGLFSFLNGVTALTNGNYVVSSPRWNNGSAAGAGAVTFCNGTSGCTGAVSSANSLVGSSAGDSVGRGNYVGNVVELTNGNYVVGSLYWDNGATADVGAVTWCNGTSGCTGAVTSANSLVGSTAGDRIGSYEYRDPENQIITAITITALPNGNYVVSSPIWDNGAVINAGAITYGDGSQGTFGAITAANSVRGTTSGGGQSFSFDAVNNQLVVGRSSVNIVTLFRLTRPTASRPQFDFDGDGKSDISVYRPSNGVWYLQQSLNGFTATQFGISTDKLAPADFDGDGKTDLAVYRNGIWYLLRSSQGFTALQFGLAEDLPTPADYDGDGKADIAVFRPSNGFWYRLNSSNGQFVAVQFGISEDKPTLGDFDGDGKSDIAVFRPSNGVWHRINSSNGQVSGFQFGISEDKPAAADYDGDGRTDIAVYRPSNGIWYRFNSTNSQSTSVQFGISEDFPTPADYDGDGRADIAVFRPSNGIWYRLNSTNSQFLGVQFGITEDKPIPAAYINSNSP